MKLRIVEDIEWHKGMSLPMLGDLE